MFVPDFAFCHPVTIEKWKGRAISRDEYGAPTETKARVNLGRKKVWKQTGEAAQEVITAGAVYLPAGTDIAPQDRRTYAGHRYTVIESRPRYWLDGAVNHVEATIQ